MNTEEWRPVAGWEGLYEVSDKGRVRGVNRQVLQRGSTWTYRGQLMKHDINKRGYHRVSLSRQGRKRTRSVHRLVAEAFIPNPEGLPMVRHWDDCLDNNTVKNLRWGTNSDNQLDAVRNGVHPKARNTHCPQGHPYAGTNLHVEGNGARRCRKCRADRERERRQQKRSRKHGS